MKLSKMSIEQYTVKSFDGLELYCKTATPDNRLIPKARILFLHGFSEYIDSYDNWFSLFTAEGYEVISYDQRGHGHTARSESDFGVSDTVSIMKDLEVMVDYASNNYNGPLVMYGFSMGAAIVLNYMVIGNKKERFDLYTSTAPYVQTHPDTLKGLNGIKVKVLPCVVKVIPNYVDKANLEPQQLTNDPSRWAMYKADPLRPCHTSARFMYDAIQRGARLLDTNFLSGIVERPLLVSQGLGDTVCDPAATIKFTQLVNLKDKTLTTYPGLPHEIHQCLRANKMDHFTKLTSWLESRLESRLKSQLVSEIDQVLHK